MHHSSSSTHDRTVTSTDDLLAPVPSTWEILTSNHCRSCGHSPVQATRPRFDDQEHRSHTFQPSNSMSACQLHSRAVHTYTHAHAQTDRQTDRQIHAYGQVRMHEHTEANANTHTHTHTRPHAHTHAHT